MAEPNLSRRLMAATPVLVTPAGAVVASAIAVVELSRRWSEAATGAVPAGPNMSPVSATAVLMAVAALLVLRRPRGPAAGTLGFAMAAATAALGLLVFAQHVAGLERDALLPGLGAWARRPSPTTGLAIAFLGTSLLALGARSERLRWHAGWAAAAALAIALASLVGHAYDASLMYGVNAQGGTAIATGTALGLVALAVLFADPARGVAALSTSGSPGGQLFRRLTPAAVLAPLLLGWLALRANAGGYIDTEFAAAILVVLLIVLLVALIVRQAMVLHEVDAERSRLLASERHASEQVAGILESITDAFFAVDADWRFTYVNSEAEHVLQRPRAELLGRSLWQEFPAALGTVFQREYERAMDGQATARFEAWYPPLEAWFDVRAFPTADGLSVYFTDVTEHKLADEQRVASETRFRMLADMIPQHIWTTDASGYHTYFSRRWYEFTGAAEGETKGHGWADRLHPEDRERTLAEWQHSLRTGERYSIQYRFRGADGQYVWFWGQAVPQRNEAGEIVTWFGTLTDISEQKRLQDEREQLLEREREARAEADRRREQLERVSESRTRLMRGFSHDVKNPLGAADGHAQLLEEGLLGDLSEKQLDSVRRIRRSISTSLQLIQDLLELARAEAGQIPIESVDTDVAQTAREVADDFRAQAAAAGLVIEVGCPDGLRAATDPTRLRQILANLLSNAVKYAPNSRATVTAEAVRDGDGPRPGDWVAVRVSDTGPGIPQEKREVIFQEFTRLDPHARAGAGVGLAISRRIAQLMDGDLTVESEVGRGSTFTLWLPTSNQDALSTTT